ncbi:glycosyltransferase family 2 protein [Robiginitalea sp. SC105]|uniref:glycosyltransferase family 2 protein n=1 Tax=Robiginitalea sp. SC105 TaxID=2762332 RepID=UPI001639AC1D|nr:glycosyltransferase family 2 protein [Robiginitalea sp. SC105]MBC2839273.1 glycosyltransferase [Robiginitalea sp. SC105]
MKVSLITATYNSCQTLRDCLNSVVAQDYPHIEHFIQDGGSVDGTLKLLEDYKNASSGARVNSEPDCGTYDALNKALFMSQGEVIGFIHSDDFLAGPSVIGKIIELFKTDEVDGVYGDLQYVRKSDANHIIRHWKSRSFNVQLLKRGWMPPHPALFLRKSVYETHGGFNLSYKIAADYDFILRVMQDPQYRFAYIPEVITKMRVGGVSNRSIRNIIRKSLEDLRALKANGIPRPLYALFLKNFSKLSQFF